MLDIKFIRENRDLVKEAARKKHIKVDIDALVNLDNKRLEMISRVEEMRARHNKVSQEIAKLSTKTGDTSDERDAMLDEMRLFKDKIVQEEERFQKVMREWRELMLMVPNIPDIGVPEGETDAENQVVKTIGKPPSFSFTPKSHLELLADLFMADFEEGANVSGFRGYFLKNDAVLLSFALWQFTIDFFAKKQFELTMAPILLKKEGFLGTGYLPQGEDDLYKTQDGAYLSGTAEVPIMASYIDRVFSADELPKKILAFSPCFRREAGSHGKDTKGLFRVHEFYKLEQVVVCEASHEASVGHHEELTANSVELMGALGIPYRVVLNCGGDLGLGQVKKYDIEAWVPSEGRYRETHSSSYFHDFQTRRLNIKYKDARGITRFAHSLNNTALATPRLLISLLENYQTEKGTIRVPAALVKFFGKDTIG